jgi:competence protein ComEC
LVAAATVIGALGVAGLGPLIHVAAFLSSIVAQLARAASVWPQVGAWAVAGPALAGLVALRWRTLRPPMFAAGAALVMVSLLGVTGTLPPEGVVVLDVGQGDAILLSGGPGSLALVDGGPDPAAVLDRLRRYGVTHIDLVVMTHGDADHAGGLAAVIDRYPVGEVWASLDPHSTESAAEVLDMTEARGVPVTSPTVGQTRRLGSLLIVVEGPRRVYEKGNDQSIVLTILGSERSMLLTGDIETRAQADLDDLKADVLKVPHHGGGTSDPGWLTGVGAGLAVISVGANDFGHPVLWVIEALEEAGSEVRRTDEEGDIVVDLG